MGAANDIPLTIRGRIRSVFYLKIAPNILLLSIGEDLLKGLFRMTNGEADDLGARTGSTDLALTATASFDYSEEHSGSNVPYGPVGHIKTHQKLENSYLNISTTT